MLVVEGELYYLSITKRIGSTSLMIWSTDLLKVLSRARFRRNFARCTGRVQNPDMLEGMGDYFGKKK